MRFYDTPFPRITIILLFRPAVVVLRASVVGVQASSGLSSAPFVGAGASEAVALLDESPL
jgi:hypothetical protein